jgi:Flp pilus assembly protein CpaB
MTNTGRLVRRVIFLLILFIVSIAVKHFVLSGMYLTKLQGAPALAASVAPSIATSDSKNIPIAGKDFKIVSANYFNNKQWAVVTVATIPDNNLATLVLENINGAYTVVLGPGTVFSTSVTQSMPPDVATYLINKGLIP